MANKRLPLFSLATNSDLSPGGKLRKQLPRGPLDPSFHFIGVGKGVWGFKNTGGARLF